MERERRLKGARWSSTVRCPRMGAYSALGAIPAPPSEEVRGLWQRGHDLETVFFDRLAPERLDYTGPIIREAAIPWGNNIGDGNPRPWELHVDGILADHPARPHVEVKANMDTATIPGHELTINGVTTKHPILQAAGAAVFDPEEGEAAVVVISPSNYSSRTYPVELSDDLRGVVLELEQMVATAVVDGELPARTCAVPTDGIGKFCPYVETCFADFEWPPAIVLEGEIAMLAGNVLAAKEELAAAKEAAEEAEARYKELRGQLPVEHGVTYGLGGIRVRKTRVKPGPDLNLKDARATGVIKPHELEPPFGRLSAFLRPKGEYDRWTIDEIPRDEWDLMREIAAEEARRREEGADEQG